MLSSSVNASGGTDAYTDLSSLNAIRDLGREDKDKALGEIAKQFESMMVRMMMKSMRSANEVFAEGNFLSSNEGDMYQDMFDDQMALTLSQGRGFGVAEVMVRQLQQRFGTEQDSPQKSDFSDYQRQGVAVTDKAAAAGQSVPESAAQANQPVKAVSFDGSVEQFVSELYPMAEKAAAKLGVEPDVLLAQAALETGWGQKITRLGDKSSLNLFNIKADQRWQGSRISVPTMEVKNGMAVREVASFRAYASLQHSFDDYVEFVSNSPRYEKALQASDSEGYIRGLSEAGYATDPQYSEKILRIVNSQAITQTSSRQL